MARNRPNWHLVLFLGLALLLASSLPGCVSSPPIINEFSASPAEITAGESTTLEWSVSAAETITIDQGIGTVPYRGSLSLSPSSTIAYTLTATNDAASVTKSVVITVKIPPPEEPPEEKPEEPKQEEEEIINALDTDKLLDIGYNHPDQVVIVEGVIVGTY